MSQILPFQQTELDQFKQIAEENAKSTIEEVLNHYQELYHTLETLKGRHNNPFNELPTWDDYTLVRLLGSHDKQVRLAVKILKSKDWLRKYTHEVELEKNRMAAKQERKKERAESEVIRRASKVEEAAKKVAKKAAKKAENAHLKILSFYNTKMDLVTEAIGQCDELMPELGPEEAMINAIRSNRSEFLYAGTQWAKRVDSLRKGCALRVAPSFYLLSARQRYQLSLAALTNESYSNVTSQLETHGVEEFVRGKLHNERDLFQNSTKKQYGIATRFGTEKVQTSWATGYSREDMLGFSNAWKNYSGVGIRPTSLAYSFYNKEKHTIDDIIVMIDFMQRTGQMSTDRHEIKLFLLTNESRVAMYVHNKIVELLWDLFSYRIEREWHPDDFTDKFEFAIDKLGKIGSDDAMHVKTMLEKVIKDVGHGGPGGFAKIPAVAEIYNQQCMQIDPKEALKSRFGQDEYPIDREALWTGPLQQPSCSCTELCKPAFKVPNEPDESKLTGMLTTIVEISQNALTLILEDVRRDRQEILDKKLTDFTTMQNLAKISSINTCTAFFTLLCTIAKDVSYESKVDQASATLLTQNSVLLLHASAEILSDFDGTRESLFSLIRDGGGIECQLYKQERTQDFSDNYLRLPKFSYHNQRGLNYALQVCEFSRLENLTKLFENNIKLRKDGANNDSRIRGATSTHQVFEFGDPGSLIKQEDDSEDDSEEEETTSIEVTQESELAEVTQRTIRELSRARLKRDEAIQKRQDYIKYKIKDLNAFDMSYYDAGNPFDYTEYQEQLEASGQYRQEYLRDIFKYVEDSLLPAHKLRESEYYDEYELFRERRLAVEAQEMADVIAKYV